MSDHPCPQPLPVLAVFDFDGTLTRRDSFFPFLHMVVGPLRFWWGLVILGPILMGYYLRLVPNWQAKEAVLTYFLAGLTDERLQQLGQRFAAQSLPKLLRPEALRRLRWHQEQGHQIVLLSASLEAYLVPWAQAMGGFNQVIGTQLAVQSGLITGRILGKNCYGPEKVKRLTTLLKDLSGYCLYAYGDSQGDRDLLDYVTYPYYRTFQDVTPNSRGFTTHWERGLLLSIVVAAALYLGFVLWSGADKFFAALNLLPFWLIPALLALVMFGYYLRFLRWQWYLQQMGYQVPLGSSFQIFLASFALTASPGKAGESIKSLLLKRRHNVAIAPTLAGLFCERFTDALSVVLLICSSLFLVAQGRAAIVVVGLVQLVIILILQQPKLIKKRVLQPLSRWPKLRSTLEKIENLVDSGSVLLKPKLLVGGTLLAFIAWGLEGVALYVIFHYLGATSITPYQGVLIHTGAGLIGALSFLPGGIGGTEALMISLSIFYGASQTAAVTATLLIRLLTLWFATVVGVINLSIIIHSSSHK